MTGPTFGLSLDPGAWFGLVSKLLSAAEERQVVGPMADILTFLDVFWQDPRFEVLQPTSPEDRTTSDLVELARKARRLRNRSDESDELRALAALFEGAREELAHRAGYRNRLEQSLPDESRLVSAFLAVLGTDPAYVFRYFHSSARPHHPSKGRPWNMGNDWDHDVEVPESSVLEHSDVIVAIPLRGRLLAAHPVQWIEMSVLFPKSWKLRFVDRPGYSFYDPSNDRPTALISVTFAGCSREESASLARWPFLAGPMIARFVADNIRPVSRTQYSVWTIFDFKEYSDQFFNRDFDMRPELMRLRSSWGAVQRLELIERLADWLQKVKETSMVFNLDDAMNAALVEAKERIEAAVGTVTSLRAVNADAVLAALPTLEEAVAEALYKSNRFAFGYDHRTNRPTLSPEERDKRVESGEVDLGPHVDRSAVAKRYRDLAEKHDVKFAVAPDGSVERTFSDDSVHFAVRGAEVWICHWPGSLASEQERVVESFIDGASGFWL